jgi:hypothetical protein
MIMLVIYLIPAANELRKEIVKDIRELFKTQEQEAAERALQVERKIKRKRRAAHFKKHSAGDDESVPGDARVTRGSGAAWRRGMASSFDGAGGEYDFEEVDAHAMLSMYDDGHEVDDHEMVEFAEGGYLDDMEKE